MIAYIVRGTHWQVPGDPLSVHFTSSHADAKAAEHVNIMLADMNKYIDDDEFDQIKGEADASNWSEMLRRLQRLRCEVADGCETVDRYEEAYSSGSFTEYLVERSECDVWIEEHEVENASIIWEAEDGKMMTIHYDEPSA